MGIWLSVFTVLNYQAVEKCYLVFDLALREVRFTIIQKSLYYSTGWYDAGL